ncbi:hypothetical protein ACLI1A_06905 [Flavobacterium sp. RHBU_3]|uniref:hypothetical protein n=1 Tax=Flavobacterium sp. RHBU_3 TaxID=3391184 RepID=UPI003984DFC5
MPTFIFIITASAVPTGWAATNASIIVSSNATEIHVDVLRISTDSATIFAWLKANYMYINFPAMYESIEKAHVISSGSAEYTVASAVSSGLYTNVTFSALQTDLSSISLSYSDHYNEYLRVYYDSTTLRFTKTTDMTLETLFSIPFIRAIMSNNSLSGTNTVFSFAKGNFATGNDIFFKVTDNGNFIGYYNFSKTNPKP